MKINIINNKAKITLVYIHGYASNRDSVNGINSKPLNFNLVSFNYPKDKAYNAQEMAKHVDTLISRIKGPVVIMGHSLGGAIMTHIHNRFKIKKYIYASALTPIIADSKAIEFLSKESKGSKIAKTALSKSLTILGKMEISKFLTPSEEFIRFANENIFNRKYLIEDLANGYSKKSKKSISFIGKEDTLFNYLKYEEFMVNKGIKCYTIDGAGHNPMNDTGSEVATILNNEIKFKKKSRKRIIKK